MATDNTPPRTKLIATLAVIVIVTLIGLDLVLKSYFAYMVQEAQAEKLSPAAARHEQFATEQQALAKAGIDKAMAQVAESTRAAMIKPEQSNDLGPMTGWSKLPKAAPQPVTTLQADAGADAATADAATAAAVSDSGAAALIAPIPTAPAPAPAPTAPAPQPTTPAPKAPAPTTPAPKPTATAPTAPAPTAAPTPKKPAAPRSGDASTP